MAKESLPAPVGLTPAPSKTATMASGRETIYEALRESHEEQRRLCRLIVRAGASNPQRRQDLLTELRIELAAHAAAEERYLYVPMLMSDMGLDASRHALSEHHEIDELVEQLQELALDGQAWGEAAKALAHEVRHHLKEEESRFFQVSGRILTDSQKTRLARQYRRDHRRMHRQLAAS